MNLARKVIFCILILILLCSAQGVLASPTGQDWGTPDGNFRDDNLAMGIDHSKPNPGLVYSLQKKLFAAKAAMLGLSQEEITKESEQFALPPADQPGMRSKGYNKQLVFLVDFPDYPHGAAQTVADADSKLNGPGDPAMWPTNNLHDFYARSSYNQLDLHSDVYGWYRAKHNRNYYDNDTWKLFAEVMTAYDSQINYANYDNDHDGDIDNIFLYWTGPDTGWSGFWWAYQNSFSYSGTPIKWDGVYIVSWCWEWYTRPWTLTGLFDSRTPCHEMGHVLGLPDYYDYNTTIGPQGGVGGFDMMDRNWLDHNSFSKYMLNWTTPIVIGSNPHDTSGGLYPTGDHQSQTSVLIMPGATLNSYSEFFLTENRAPGYGNDPTTYWGYDKQSKSWKDLSWSKRGLTIWHVDYTLDPVTHNFKYDNSYASHKLLRLMEADGQEDIENFLGWNQDDIYGLDEFFGPTTTPNSNNYAGSDTYVHVQDIEPLSIFHTVWARWMIGEYPPTVTSMIPNSGTQNTLLSVTDLQGSNFWFHPQPKVYIWYRIKIGTFYVWFQEYATNVKVVSRNKITCTFDLAGIPPGQYTVYVQNPDGETGTLTNGLTVNPPRIHVTVPNGGEKWSADTSHTITWTQVGLDNTSVRIDLWKEWPVGVYQRSIAASVPADDGYYVWHIPADVTPSPHYWVNISSLSYPSVNDYTDGWLEITDVPQPLVSVKKYISSNNASWNDTAIDVIQGTKVYYNVTIQNTGNCVLSSVMLADGGSYATYSMLQPGASWTLYYSATAGATDHTNTVTVGATSPWGNPPPAVTDTATYHVIKPIIMVQPSLTEIGLGSTKTVTVVMDHAPTGLSGYKLTITPSSPPFTQVLSVSFPAWGGIPSTSTLPGDTFWMKAGDYTNQVKSGAKNVLLGSLTVRGDQCGTTVFSIGADQVDDDFGNPISPSTVSGTIRVVPMVVHLPGYANPPTDPDSDCIYEDLNANGRLDFADVVLYFNQMTWIAANEPVSAFDLNRNGRIDFADIVALFNEI